MPAVATSFKVTLPVADKFELSVIPPVVAVAARVPVTAPCNAKAASLVIAVFPAAVRITFASASKVSKVMPAVATSFKVTLPVADKFELSPASIVVAVAKVPVSAPCNAKALSLVIAVWLRSGSHSRPLPKYQGDAGGRHIVQGNITGG